MSLLRFAICGALLGCVLLGTAGARADDEPGTYAGKDAAWWVGELARHDTEPAARVALVKIGAPALGPLADALRSEARSLRWAAASVLRLLPVDLAPILPDLLEALESEDPHFRRSILKLLRKVGPAVADHLDRIRPLVSSSDPEVARGAIGIAQVLGPAGLPLLPAVLARLAEGPEGLRSAALTAAIAIDPAAEAIVPALATALARSGDPARRQLLGSTRNLAPSTAGYAELVAGAAADPDAGVRKAAAGLLAQVVVEAPEHAAVLFGLLEDPDESVRLGALYAVGRVGARAQPAVPAITRILADADATLHVAAIRALVAVKGPARDALPLVLEAMDRANPSRDLTGAGTAFIAMEPALTLQVLAHENVVFRDIAIQIVSGWSPDRWKGSLVEIVGAVEQALLRREKTGYVERRILQTLGRLATDHDEAAAALLALRHARDEKVRRESARLLGASPKSRGLLLEMLAGEDAVDRAFAVDALMQALTLGARQPTGELRGALFRILREGSPNARAAAGRLLVLRGGYFDPGTLPPDDAEILAAAAADLLDTPDAGAAVGRLTMLGRHGLPYVGRLAKLLDIDALKSPGRQAAWALAAIGRADEECRAAVLPLLLPRLRGDDPVAAANAVTALVVLGEHDAELLERLPALARNPKKTVHFQAVDAISHMGERAATLLPLLLDMIANPLPGTHVDSWAVNALARIAPDDPRVVKALLGHLRDAAWRQKNGNPAVGTLQQGGDTTIDLVAADLASAPAEVQVLLLRVLANYGLKASRVREHVRPLTKSPDARVSQAAEQALQRLGS